MPAFYQDGFQFALRGSLKRHPNLTSNLFDSYGTEKRARPYEFSHSKETRDGDSVGPLSMQERLRLASQKEGVKDGSPGETLNLGVKQLTDETPTKDLGGCRPVPISMRAEFARPGTGLANLGNTCYLNSVLQCLLHSPPLHNFLRYRHHSEYCEFRGRKPADGFCPLCLLEMRLKASFSDDHLKHTRPLFIAKSLHHFAPQLSIGDQEDAHELLRLMIDSCHRTCLLQQRGLPLSALKRFEDRTGKVPTVISDIFGGLLQSQVKCLTCGAESNKRDIFMDLSLDIGSSIHSVYGALQAFVLPETLEGSNRYRCEKCKQLSRARKQMQILRAPNVLVIQLKRFENIFGGKITKYINVSETLSLFNVMAPGVKEPRPEYTLYALIVHEGSTQQSGHYYAFAQVNRCWYEFNDSNVSPVNWATISRRGAYILFYIKTQPRGQVLFYPPKTQGPVNGGVQDAQQGRTQAVKQTGPQLQQTQTKDAEETTDDRGEKSQGRPVYGPQLPPPGYHSSVGTAGNQTERPPVSNIAGPSSSVEKTSSAVRISSESDHSVNLFNQTPPNSQAQSPVSQAVTVEGSSRKSVLATGQNGREVVQQDAYAKASLNLSNGREKASIMAHSNGAAALDSKESLKKSPDESGTQAVGTASSELLNRKRKASEREDPPKSSTRREFPEAAVFEERPHCAQNGSSSLLADTSKPLEELPNAASGRIAGVEMSIEGPQPDAVSKTGAGASKTTPQNPQDERTNDGATAGSGHVGGRVELLVEASKWSMAFSYDSDEEEECKKMLSQESEEKEASSQGVGKEIKQLPGLLEAEALLQSGIVSRLPVQF